EQCGEDIAVVAVMNDQVQPTEPIVLAELKDPAGFRAFFDSEVQKLSANGKAPQVVWVEDPRNAQPVMNSTGGDKQLYVWIAGDVLVGSPKLDQLQTIAKGGSGFSSMPFYSRFAQLYYLCVVIFLVADM